MIYCTSPKLAVKPELSTTLGPVMLSRLFYLKYLAINIQFEIVSPFPRATGSDLDRYRCWSMSNVNLSLYLSFPPIPTKPFAFATKPLNPPSPSSTSFSASIFSSSFLFSTLFSIFAQSSLQVPFLPHPPTRSQLLTCLFSNFFPRSTFPTSFPLPTERNKLKRPGSPPPRKCRDEVESDAVVDCDREGEGSL